MTELHWTSDFDFSGRRVRVRKTGAHLHIDAGLLADVWRWLGYYGPVRLKGAVTRLVSPGPRIWFGPDMPRPWYLIWLAASWGGLRFVRSPELADVRFFFEDATVGPAPAGMTGLNFGCTDVSKSHVAEVFEQVFGYPLRLDPRQHSGLAVEKGEMNGAHDGRLIDCPTSPEPGRVYQHLIDNQQGDVVVDFRTPCVDGRPVLVFIKRRPVFDRFANYNRSVDLARPEDHFSPDEIDKIGDFCRAMQLDWGGLDVLRDATSGRLYIVDVNKTDMPPLRLPWRQKMKAIDLLSKALGSLIQSRSTGTAA
jgi:hypothetical protein